MNLSILHVDGRQFKDDTGKPWPYVNMTAFALFKRYLEPTGPEVVVGPTLDLWRAMATEAGLPADFEITLRVFRFAGGTNPFALDPWSYPMAAVTEFTQFCNDRHFRVDWTCGDAQLVLPNQDGPTGQQEHLNQFCAALVPIQGTNFIQTCNEPFKNGIDVSRIIPPQWGTYLRCSGMYYEGRWDASTNLDFINYHTPRATEGAVVKWVTKAFEAAPYLWLAGRAPVQDEMMGFDEVNSGNRSAAPDYAFLLGLAVAVTGVGFHSTLGRSCNAFGPVTRACCVSFMRGVKGGLGL